MNYSDIKPTTKWDQMTAEQRDEFRVNLRAEQEAKMQAAISETKEITRNARWRDLVDDLYREDFDFKKIDPRANGEEIQAILKWNYSAIGLWIGSESGFSKSRAVFALAKRMIWEDRSVEILDGAEFSHLAIQSASDYERTKYITKRLCGPDVLIIDDLGKRSTKSTWEQLFSLFERRSSQKKPVIVTTNFVKEGLKLAISDDHIYFPLQRRIKEFCQIIKP